MITRLLVMDVVMVRRGRLVMVPVVVGRRRLGTRRPMTPLIIVRTEADTRGGRVILSSGLGGTLCRLSILSEFCGIGFGRDRLS